MTQLMTQLERMESLESEVKSLKVRLGGLTKEVRSQPKGGIVTDKAGYSNWTGSYNDYLKTDHWKKTRMRILKKKNFRCSVCSKPAKNVHHHSYKNLGYERDYELSALCARCHELIHR